MVKRLICLMLTGALVVPVMAGAAFAGEPDKAARRQTNARSSERYDKDRNRDRGRNRDRWDHHDRRHRDRHRVEVYDSRRYVGPRDVIVVRDYYRPHHRPLPRGLQTYYTRHGHLPPGWVRTIRPVPVYLERQLLPLPRGYQRGIIDGHLVVHDRSGFIFDVAVLF